MIIEKVKTPGVAHFSYLVGGDNSAAVIDPRRDISVYLQKAAEHGLRITHIFETHRDEDLLSGSALLAAETGATVLHGPHADGEIAYAETVEDGQIFQLGKLTLQVMETPGHTNDHIALALFDENYSETAVGVFTGDTLFVGDIGRADFYPEHHEQMAGKLYRSLGKLLALGDQAIIYPAHGSGSVCGSAMAEREFSTIGHERKNNPLLQISDEAAFIREKIRENHYFPPYFRTMEGLNLTGATRPRINTMPRVFSSQELDEAGFDWLVDLRHAAAFAAAHLPGSISLPLSLLSAFAGWFLQAEQRLVLVGQDGDEVMSGITQLSRIGFDRIVGCVINPVAVVSSGRRFGSLAMLDNEAVKERLHGTADIWELIDVRSTDEKLALPVKGARDIYIGHLHDHWQELDPSHRFTLMCGSGMRATVAASWLVSRGLAKVDVYLGSPAQLK